MAHKTIKPAIHYWGTPVILISTLNEDGSVNVAPMSSAWWLGWSCMLGLDASTQTVQNLKREGQCVLNLASMETAEAVNKLARTTGSKNVPLHKKVMGWRYEPEKLKHAGLTAEDSVHVRSPRIRECLVQLEAVVMNIHPFAKDDSKMAVAACAVEVKIVEVHVDESLLLGEDKIDSQKWKPLIMSFRDLFVMGESTGESRLAKGDENMWAPWKKGLVTRLISKAIGVASEHRYGIKKDEEKADNEDS